MSTATATTKVVTGPGIRFSYANVFEPTAMEEGQEKKYNVVALIPKKDTATVNKIKAAIKLAFDNGKATFGGKVPAPGTWKDPLRDGDAEKPDDENYKGMYFLSAKSKTRPQIVDENMNAIIDREDFYSGCYGRISINFYAFAKAGNKGVGAGLNNIQKLADGDKLSGSSSAAVDFGEDNESLM